MPVEHLIPRFGDGPMRMPPVGPCTVVEAEPDDGVELFFAGAAGAELLLDGVKHSPPFEVGVMLDAREARQLAEQILFVLDGSVIVATNRLEGY